MITFSLSFAAPGSAAFSTAVPLADYGLARPRRRLVSQAVSTLTLSADGLATDAAPLWPYLSAIIVYRTVTTAAAPPAPAASVTTQWFYGVLTKIPAFGSGRKESQEYEISDPWWYLENLVYQQQWLLSLTGTGAVFGAVTLSIDGKRAITGVAIVSGGSDYTSGEFLFFADSTGSGAYARINCSGGVITSVMVVKGGLGYTDPQVGMTNDPYRSHCFLNPWVSVPGSSGSNPYFKRQPTDFQIKDVFTFAGYAASQSGQTIPIQLQSSLDADLSIDIPTEEVRDITCAEVIRKQLRWMPEAVTWFDYTTSPPTLYIRRQADLIADGAIVSLGAQASSLPGISNLTVSPRYDLQRPVVAVNFEQLNQVSGSTTGTQTWETVWRDIYPTPSGSPARPTGYEVTALVVTIALEGLQQQDTSATLIVGALSSVAANTVLPLVYDSANDPSLDNWWLAKQPWLVNTVSGTPQINALQYTDSQGNVTTSPPAATPNELVSGQIAPWMTTDPASRTPIIAQDVLMTATISYTQGNQVPGTDLPFGRYSGPTASQASKTASVRVRLTNAPVSSPAGSQTTYETTASYLYPEAIPTTLARSLYQSVSPLVYEGSVTIAEQDCSGLAAPGIVLNLTGSSNAAWSTMNALVQTSIEDLENGLTEVRFGPPKHLGASDLVELLRLNRFRVLYVNPAAQLSARQPGNQTQLGQDTAIENSLGHTASYNAIGAYVPQPASYGSGWPANMGSSLLSGGTVTATVPNPGSHVPSYRGQAVLLGGSITLQREDQSAPVSGNASVPDGQKAGATALMAIADLLGSDGNYHAVSFQEVSICVSGVQKRIITLCSSPY